MFRKSNVVLIAVRSISCHAADVSDTIGEMEVPSKKRVDIPAFRQGVIRDTW